MGRWGTSVGFKYTEKADKEVYEDTPSVKKKEENQADG